MRREAGCQPVRGAHPVEEAAEEGDFGLLLAALGSPGSPPPSSAYPRIGVDTVGPVLYRLVADAVVVVHFAFIVFVAVGGLMAWRWPRLLWLHVPAVAWGLGIVTLGYVCPLTPLEKHFRRRGGAEGYEGGFVDRYIEDVVYPDEYTPHVRLAAAALIAIGWTGVVRRLRHRPGRLPVLGRRDQRP